MEASLTGPGGQLTDLTSNVLTIGRAPDNQLVLQDQQASSHHAEIRPDAQGYLLIDANSRNGTFVNEQRLMPQTPRLLISGDVIRIGETRLTYSSGNEDEATVRASSPDYGRLGYSPTVAVPPPAQPDYASYQQPLQPPYTDYQQPAPPAPGYPPISQPDYGQQPAPGYPPVSQPDYGQPPQPYPTPAYSQPPQGYPQTVPWAGAPGQFGVPAAPVAEQPKKRSRTGLIIGLIVLILLVVGGSVYFFVLRSTPEKTLSAFCNAYTSSDAQGLFNQLSASAQSKTSVAQLTQQFHAVDAAPINGFKTCTFNNVQQSGSTATADVSLTLGNATLNPLIKPFKVRLVDENGTWKVDSAAQPSPTQ